MIKVDEIILIKRMTYHYQLTQNIQWQKQAIWQPPDTPFMTFAYWQALIDSAAIGEQAGWIPIYIVICKNEVVEPVAVMPVFIKGHHQGEYVFDHAWADAYARHGVDYYPRLVTSVPYTPVAGQRLWLTEGVELDTDILQTALQAVDAIAKQTQASSWHGLFVNDDVITLSSALTKPFSEKQVLKRQLLERQGCQFLWHNKNLTNGNKPFANFDEFLSTLTAKKRKNIRAERKKIAKQGLTCHIKLGADITEHDWQVFYECYAMTYAIRGRHPYLTLSFFKQIAQSMTQSLMLAQAVDETGNVVASSLFFYDNPHQDNARLYGRYWGALAEYDSLHFELCYYQGIEFAITQGLAIFDPGTQGEHKLIRGFVPTKTHSLHRIYDARFEPAIANFCAQDRAYMQQYRRQAYEALPFNIENMPKFDG